MTDDVDGDRSTRWLGAVTIAVLTIGLCAAGVGHVAGQSVDATDGPAESITVSITADGDGTITVTSTYDLDDELERDAFEDLQDDPDALEAHEAAFEDRMTVVATAITETTDREVSVVDTEAHLETAEEVGVARLQVELTGVAAVEDGRLVLTEPFASGYAPDRPLVVELPDGFAAADAAVLPNDVDEDRLVWSANRSLSGFELVGSTEADPGTVETVDGDGSGAGDPTPGFGPLAAILAVLAAGVVLGRRVGRDA